LEHSNKNFLWNPTTSCWQLLACLAIARSLERHLRFTNWLLCVMQRSLDASAFPSKEQNLLMMCDCSTKPAMSNPLPSGRIRPRRRFCAAQFRFSL